MNMLCLKINPRFTISNAVFEGCVQRLSATSNPSLFEFLLTSNNARTSGRAWRLYQGTNPRKHGIYQATQDQHHRYQSALSIHHNPDSEVTRCPFFEIWGRSCDVIFAVKSVKKAPVQSHRAVIARCFLWATALRLALVKW